jgi:hypothetical protein
VNEKRTDRRAALRGLAAGESGEAGPHCGLKRLIAYRQGTMPAAERENVQEHLSLCPRCTGLLRELRDFEAAVERGEEAGPEAQRQEAWDALARRLPAKTPAIRPIASAARGETQRRLPRLVLAAAAALLLAAIGLALWAAITVLEERQRLARLERRLEERDSAVTALRSSLAEAERQLGVARGQIQDLAKEGIDQRSSREAGGRDQIAAASPDVEVSVGPRYVLRGQETPGSAFLHGGGEVNPVRTSLREHRFTVALSLADQPAYDEYRVELVDGDGKVLWAGRRPDTRLLGDAGTSVSIRGLGPGRYRLRVSGLHGDRGDRLAEYLLEVGS